jgi:hypothetical protein
MKRAEPAQAFSRFLILTGKLRWHARIWGCGGTVDTRSGGWHRRDFARNIDGGRDLLRLGPLADHYDGRRACSPGREHVGPWNQFDNEGRQQQHVEPNRPRDENHANDVQTFIHENPTQRPQPELQAIYYYRDEKGEPNPPFGQHGPGGSAKKILKKVHLMEVAELLTLRAYSSLARSATGLVGSGGQLGRFSRLVRSGKFVIV